MSAVDETIEAPPEPDQAEPATEPEHGGEVEPDPADDDDETPDEAELEPEQAPPTGPSEAEVEAKLRKVERSFATYTKAVERELGDLADDLTPCPLCSDTPAGFVNVNAIGSFPPEVVQVIDTFLGKTLEAEYPDSKDYRPCSECDALGKVRTGSKVPQQETLPCPKCGGRGFVSTAPSGANGHVDQVPALAAVAADANPAASDDADYLGSPRLLPNGLENPNFGRMPQYKDPAYP